MRIHDNAVVTRIMWVAPRHKQRVVLWWRFNRQHVDSGTRELAGTNRRRDRSRIHSGPACGVHQIGAIGHQTNAASVDDVPRLWRQRTMHAEHKHLAEEIVQLLHAAKTESLIVP